MTERASVCYPLPIGPAGMFFWKIIIKSIQALPRGMPIALILVVGFVYIQSLPLGPVTDDTAEFQTECALMGPIHAPGYPLLQIIGKVFAMIPIGEIAWRVALMSVTFGLATLWLLYGLIDRLTMSPLAAATGTLALAFSHTFWMQSVLAEAYTLNAFFIVAIWRLMMRSLQAPADRGRIWVACAFLVGLAFGNHQTIILLAPMGCGWFLWLEIRNGVCFRRLARGFGWAVGLGLLGLTIYIVLILRLTTYGQTIFQAIELARGGNARGLLFIFTPAQVVDRTLDFCMYQVFQYLGPGIILFLIGIPVLWSCYRPWFWALGYVYLLTVIWGVNFDSSDVYVFYVPAYLAAAVSIGVAVGALQHRWRRDRFMMGLLGGICLAVFAGPPVCYALIYRYLDASNRIISADKGNRYYFWPPKRDAVWMSDNVRGLLEVAPPWSLFISEWSYIKTAAYFSRVERFRTDVFLADRARNEKGVNTWIRKTKEFYGEEDGRMEPVIYTGTDRYVSAQYQTWPLGSGVMVTLDANPYISSMNVGNTIQATRGKTVWIPVSAYYIGGLSMLDLEMRVASVEKSDVLIPIARPLSDWGGRSVSTRFSDVPSSASLATARPFSWPLHIPRYLENGELVEPGLYRIEIRSVDPSQARPLAAFRLQIH